VSGSDVLLTNDTEQLNIIFVRFTKLVIVFANPGNEMIFRHEKDNYLPFTEPVSRTAHGAI
jgi:hypothetical protein